MSTRRWRSAALLVPLLLAAWWLFLSPVSAQEPQEPALDIEVEVDPPAATVGDLVTLRVLVDHGPEVVVTARPPDLADGDLVESPLPETEVLADGNERTTIEFVVQPFSLGALPVDEIAVEWLDEDSRSGVVSVEVPGLEIVPVRDPGDTELRPLPGQMDVPGAPPAWVQPAIVAGVVAATTSALFLLGLLAWRRWRGRRPLATLDVSAEEGARAVLDGLLGQSLETEADFEHYYATISMTMRRYLEERFEFNATALTTTQLSDRMTDGGVDRWQARLVSGLLMRCDSAVYARDYPDPASADHDLTVAYEIVELSRPTAPADREAVAA